MPKRKAKPLPAFGDCEAIRQMRKSGEYEALRDEERKLHGKVYVVRVKYNTVQEHDKTLEVLALDDDDAEEVACNKVLTEEAGADDDTIDPTVVEVREQGSGKDDTGTLEMFSDLLPEYGKSE
jgi:hypothetical protein